MGWMKTLLLGDIGNRLDIQDNERDIASIRRKQQHTFKTLRNRDQQIQALQKDLSEQKLAMQALTHFLINKGILQKDELQKFVEAIEAKDEVGDGHNTLKINKKKPQYSLKRK